MASKWVTRKFALSDSMKISAGLKIQYTLLQQIINGMFYCELRYLFPNNYKLIYDVTQNIYSICEYEVYFVVSGG